MSSDLVRARRTLLSTPLLIGDLDPDAYTQVATNLQALQQWFDEECSWTIDHDRTDRTVRLHKIHADPPAAPPQTAANVTLTPRRITLALVAAAHLAAQGAATIVTAATLRDRVMETCEGRDDLPDLDLASNQNDRRDLTAAFRWLTDPIGAFDVIDGDVADAMNRDDGNALLRIRASVCAMLLTSDAPSDPTTPPDQVRAINEPASDDYRERQMRTTAVRTLVDRPAVYRDQLPHHDLPPTAVGRLTSRLRRVASDVDLQIEQREEGWAGIDTVPAQPLSPVAFPYRTSTVAHCALLLAEHAAARARAGTDTVTTDQLQHRTRQLIDTYARRARWAKSYVDNPATLTADAIDLLAAHDLISPADTLGSWTVAPICGRYAPQEATPADATLLDPAGTDDA